MKEIAKELYETKTYLDPVRSRLLETRRVVLEQWATIADTLDAQGETVLAGDVRHFAQHLPRVLTHKERLATQLVNWSSIKRRTDKLPRIEIGPKIERGEQKLAGPN